MVEAGLAGKALIARLRLAWHRAVSRLFARLGGFRRRMTAFVSQPEPISIGSYAKGRQLMAGNFMFAGYLVHTSSASIWEINSPAREFDAALQGFSWLDDLAAVGDRESRLLAQQWVFEWIDRFGRGRGPGWEPELVGRRIIRWVNHGVFLIKGLDDRRRKRFFASLARQAAYLSRRAGAAPAGLPRFEALTGLVIAGLSLEGLDHLVGPAMRAIGEECARCIDEQGGIPSRNPEELMEIFTLLNWAATALGEAGMVPQRGHLEAIEHIAPTLRSLRHLDGSLARFHGGDAGAEGRLDHALAASGVRGASKADRVMGYARLAAGRSSVIVDAAAPPEPPHSANAHASTLAFELVSGRQPLIVNCGPGHQFGREWRRAGRVTPSHSTLSVHGYSSSRLVSVFDGGSANELLVDGPDVECRRWADTDGYWMLASHDGYVEHHGLTHVRKLKLSIDGRELSGWDSLGSISESDRMIFEELMNHTALEGPRFDIRFHLHPDVSAEIGMGGSAVSLTLPNREIWVFRYEGNAVLALEASVYLDSGRLKPRAAKQIVLSGTIMDYSGGVSWSLSREHDGLRHYSTTETDESLTETR